MYAWGNTCPGSRWQQMELSGSRTNKLSGPCTGPPVRSIHLRREMGLIPNANLGVRHPVSFDATQDQIDDPTGIRIEPVGLRFDRSDAVEYVNQRTPYVKRMPWIGPLVRPIPFLDDSIVFGMVVQLPSGREPFFRRFEIGHKLQIGANFFRWLELRGNRQNYAGVRAFFPARRSRAVIPSVQQNSDEYAGIPSVHIPPFAAHMEAQASPLLSDTSFGTGRPLPSADSPHHHCEDFRKFLDAEIIPENFIT